MPFRWPGTGGDTAKRFIIVVVCDLTGLEIFTDYDDAWISEEHASSCAANHKVLLLINNFLSYYVY